VEREIRLTGVGGQGIQLAGQVLARAAVHEGRHVMTLGTYGGTMRGGNTDYTLVVADEPIATPPIVPRFWAALAMHHQFFGPTRERLRPDSLVAVDEALFDATLDRGAQRVLEVPATRIATELGSAMAGSMVLTGAFAAWCRLVGIEALVSAMCDSVPSYRQEHIERNEAALRAGFDCFDTGLADEATAWPS
jgi:2-oxoglutarate ferredoxin oxidoreductase subunit gamma